MKAKPLPLIAAALLSLATGLGAQSRPENYVFFNLDREGLRKASFYEAGRFAGAQVKYSWRSLEKGRDNYDFSAIEEDLAFLSSKGKKLFVQIQDVSFDPAIKNVPAYILDDPAYHGGADLQYDFADDKDSKAVKMGWVSRRWDPEVAGRFHRLLAELGKRFDGRIAGLTLPESSVDFGSTGAYWPKGFSPASYRDSVLATMASAASAFRKTVVIQYANFMPGEWLPWDDKGYLASVFETAIKLRIGAGGPDLIPNRKGQMNHSYHFAAKYHGSLPLGYAVQEGNYAQKNQATGKRVSVPELWDFATTYLHADYIFWYPEEPYFSRDVLPFLAKAPR